MGPRPRAFAFLLLLIPFAASAAPPRPAPPIYASANYGLTFRSPRGATYCPLPRDWVGLDHGTTLFLEPPRGCGNRAGFPSIARDFAPASVARIDLYYGYDVLEDGEAKPQPCREIGRQRFLGALPALCRTDEAGAIIVTVAGHYVAERHADGTSLAGEAALTLVTRATRLARDLTAFWRVAASLRPCSAVWRGPHDRFTTGVGPRCPRRARWF